MRSCILFLNKSNIICSCNKSYELGNDISNYNYFKIWNSIFFNSLLSIFNILDIFNNISSFSSSNFIANYKHTIP